MARYKKGVLVKFARFFQVPALKVIVLRRYDELSDLSTLYIIARYLYSMLRGVPLRAAHF